MELKIFDVEHGGCALLTADDGRMMMIDCATNPETGWTPTLELEARGTTSLELLAITNYDEDHVRGLPELESSIDVRWLSRNKSVSADTIRHLKSEDGMGDAIDRLCDVITNKYTGLGTFPEFAGVERKSFYASYPTFDDENNLSMVMHLMINGVGFMFPGDLETSGWLHLLETNEGFRKAVCNTKVFVASHHGRQSGVCKDLFAKYSCKPQLIVISDHGIQYDTQDTVAYYRSCATGISYFRAEGERRVLTTRTDGDITFKWNGNSCHVS